MTSTSLHRWSTVQAAELDQLEAAHAALGGARRGRRWATQQVNHAYAVLLSSQFQGFCRDLHSESVDYFASAVNPTILRSVLRTEFTLSRQLDRGNPAPGNIASDFNRMGLFFWSQVQADDARNKARQAKLEQLRDWRNAIAHQDFNPLKLAPSFLTLRAVRAWRQACNALAFSFDRVMRRHLGALTGSPPW